VQLPPSGPPEGQPPPSIQPYATPQPAAYYIAPTDGGAVWALVLGVLGFVTCPIIGLIAFFTGSSALSRIAASQGRLQGDGIARAGRNLGCINVLLWLLGVIGIFFVFAACGLGVSQLSHLTFPSPSP